MNEKDYSQYTVLVVDDIPTNILLVKGMLSKLKFNILSANSGQQALDLLGSTHPDIILMDILMPGMNGFEATRAIRSNTATADIPVVMLSALNSDSDVKKGLEAGANEFITKPFVQEHIINSIITQINLAESRRKNKTGSTEAASGWNNAWQLLACLLCIQSEDAVRLADMILSVPSAFLNEDFQAVATQPSTDNLVNWTSQRLRNWKLQNQKLSIDDCLNQTISLLSPAAKIKKVTWQVQLDTPLNVVADPVLINALFTNLLSCACQLASGQVTVSGSMDGGLANLIITCRPDKSAQANTDFRTALALEIALKMNGAVTCEQTPDSQYRFQVLLQTWQKPNN